MLATVSIFKAPAERLPPHGVTWSQARDWGRARPSRPSLSCFTETRCGLENANVSQSNSKPESFGLQQLNSGESLLSEGLTLPFHRVTRMGDAHLLTASARCSARSRRSRWSAKVRPSVPNSGSACERGVILIDAPSTWRAMCFQCV